MYSHCTADQPGKGEPTNVISELPDNLRSARGRRLPPAPGRGEDATAGGPGSGLRRTRIGRSSCHPEEYRPGIPCRQAVPLPTSQGAGDKSARPRRNALLLTDELSQELSIMFTASSRF